MLCQTPKNVNEVFTAKSKYQYHPSIKTLFENCNFSFSFKTVSLTDIQEEMKSLDTNKASYSSDVPANILKQNADFFIFVYVKKSTSSSTFTSVLKLVDITRVSVIYRSYGILRSECSGVLILPKLSHYAFLQTLFKSRKYRPPIIKGLWYMQLVNFKQIDNKSFKTSSKKGAVAGVFIGIYEIFQNRFFKAHTSGRLLPLELVFVLEAYSFLWICFVLLD